MENLEELFINNDRKVICCGYFNGQNALWDNDTDINGEIIEEIMDRKNLVCVNGDVLEKKYKWESGQMFLKQ